MGKSLRRLEGPELAAYDLIAPDLARRVRIGRAPFLAPGAAGMTLGRVILLRRDDDRTGRRELLAHELVHVAQFAENGFARFLIRYVRSYLIGLFRLRSHRAAYLAIPAEEEARNKTTAWALRHP